MQPPLLPLFPLGVVLFPRTPLPLHIFEERYKQMIGEAIAARSEFGIVLAGEKGIVNTGCTAVVERVVNRYPDGRLDILVCGRRRFEILLLNDEAAYIRAAVDFFDDEPEDAAPPNPSLRERLVELYRAFEERDLLGSAEVDLDDPQLSFQIAQLVPDLSVRQVVLATRNEQTRIEQLLAYLPGLLQKQLATARARAVAPRNGNPHAGHRG